MPVGRYQDETASSAGSAWRAELPGHNWYVSLSFVYFSCPEYHSNEATVKTIWWETGVRGFYRGLGPTILGYLPTWAIYFAVYDGIKTVFGQPPQSSTTKERLYPAAQVKGYQPVMREHPWTLHILSAMTAGGASTICTNPLWVIKTRFMVCFLRFIYVVQGSCVVDSNPRRS